MKKFAIIRITSRSVVWTGEAQDATSATVAACSALEYERAPSSWHVLPAADLPDDLRDEAAAWSLDV